MFIDPRFCGPPGIANGGFACGSLAALLGGAAEVTLRRPLPLGRTLPVREDGDGVLVVPDDGGPPLAEARRSAVEPEPAVPPVPAELARAVAGRAAYYLAATDGRVHPEVVWAALDCPSALAAGEAAGLTGDTSALLGRMSARLLARPRPGEECRVVAWPVARDGRKLTARSALLAPDGGVPATARTLWLTVPRPALRPAAGATR